MAALTALVYAEGNGAPDQALETLRSSEICSRIYLAGFDARQLAAACGSDLEISSQSWAETANRIAAKEAHENQLLLVSALAKFSSATIQKLVENLGDGVELAGANPVFTTYDRAFVSHLGTVADSLGYLYYFYEGLPSADPLANKRRVFQLGHPGLLLLRCEDFRRLGGIPAGELGFFGFCKDLAAIRPGGFATIPQAEAAYENRAGQLRILGVLNSLNMRGKLRDGTFRSDYAEKVEADGLLYGINDWLQEGPASKLYNAESAWSCWRNDANPQTLLALLASLGQHEAVELLNLIREYPCYLPAQMRWYEVMAEKKLEFADKAGLTFMADQIRAWQKRARSFHYGHLRKGMNLLKDAGIYNRSLDRCPAVYDAWLELAPEARPARIEIGRDWPKIAVAMPVYNPNYSFFRQAVESVRRQTYPNWQLCMADDASTDPEIRPMLEAMANEDKRIKVVFRPENGHISRATNSALELVEAPWTAFMDNDDLLAPDALAEVAKAASDNPGLKLIFSDLDHIDAQNVRRNPVFKPDHDYDHNFVEHLACYNTAFLKELGGLRFGYEGSQDRDLSLRAIERINADKILHIPRILYHWRVHPDSTSGTISAKPYAIEATRKSLFGALERRKLDGTPVETEVCNLFRIAYVDTRCASWAVAFINGEPEEIEKLKPFDELRAENRTAFYSFIEPANGARKSTQMRDIQISPDCQLDLLGILKKATAIKEDVVLFVDCALIPDGSCKPAQLLIEAQRRDLIAVGSLIWHGTLLHNGGLYPDVSGELFPLLQGTLMQRVPYFCWSLFSQPHPAISPSPLCFAMRRETIRKFAASGLDGPYALAEFCLQESAKGTKVLISPWGQWELVTEPKREMATEAEKSEFIRKWGDTIKRSGLRNPNLRAAPDNDWTLILPA